MKTTDALRHFGTKTAIAQALGISCPSVTEWGQSIPLLRQIQLEWLTKGKLRADAAAYSPRRNGVRQKVRHASGQ